MIAAHVPAARAHALASKLAQSHDTGGTHGPIPHFVRVDFAYATRSVLYAMAAIMALAAIVAFLGLQAGMQPHEPGAEPGGLAAAPDGAPGTAGSSSAPAPRAAPRPRLPRARGRPRRRAPGQG